MMVLSFVLFGWVVFMLCVLVFLGYARDRRRDLERRLHRSWTARPHKRVGDG